eukprot:14289827-Alexandrium_andersonii.AAC.1
MLTRVALGDSSVSARTTRTTQRVPWGCPAPVPRRFFEEDLEVLVRVFRQAGCAATRRRPEVRGAALAVEEEG